jgi:ribonuclease HI
MRRPRKNRDRTLPAHADLALFTDASYCQHTGVAGWAVWMKNAEMEAGVTHSAAIRETTRGAGEAELIAVANGLYLAVRYGRLKPGGSVLIQSDRLDALAIIRKATRAQDRRIVGGEPVPVAKRPAAYLRDHAALKLIVELEREHTLTLFVRHVRAHQEGAGRTWVNNRVDELAKAAMRRRRAELETRHAPQ